MSPFVWRCVSEKPDTPGEKGAGKDLNNQTRLSGYRGGVVKIR